MLQKENSKIIDLKKFISDRPYEYQAKKNGNDIGGGDHNYDWVRYIYNKIEYNDICYRNILYANDHSSIVLTPTESCVPFNIFKKWLDLCKQYFIIPNDIELLEDRTLKFNNTYPKFDYYCILCCYRFADSYGHFVWDVLELHEKYENANIWQILDIKQTELVDFPGHTWNDIGINCYRKNSYNVIRTLATKLMFVQNKKKKHQSLPNNVLYSYHKLSSKEHVKYHTLEEYLNPKWKILFDEINEETKEENLLRKIKENHLI